MATQDWIPMVSPTSFGEVNGLQFVAITFGTTKKVLKLSVKNLAFKVVSSTGQTPPTAKMLLKLASARPDKLLTLAHLEVTIISSLDGAKLAIM